MHMSLLARLARLQLLQLPHAWARQPPQRRCMYLGPAQLSVSPQSHSLTISSKNHCWRYCRLSITRNQRVWYSVFSIPSCPDCRPWRSQYSTAIIIRACNGIAVSEQSDSHQIQILDPAWPTDVQDGIMTSVKHCYHTNHHAPEVWAVHRLVSQRCLPKFISSSFFGLRYFNALSAPQYKHLSLCQLHMLI